MYSRKIYLLVLRRVDLDRIEKIYNIYILYVYICNICKNYVY